MEKADCNNTRDRLEWIWTRNLEFPQWCANKIIPAYYIAFEGGFNEETVKRGEAFESVLRDHRRMTHRKSKTPNCYGTERGLQEYRAEKYALRMKKKWKN